VNENKPVSRLIVQSGGELCLPALATAHSHAFQRALRGRAERPSFSLGGACVPGSGAALPGGGDDFWSWRGQMYALASNLTPESIHAVSLVAFRELSRAGVRTVGEFHYVHHQPDGTPYGERTLLADAVIDAAKQAQLRIALLRVAYHRAGPGRDPEPGQRRFCDPRVDDVLRDVDALRARWNGDPDVVIGLAAHSVRAVPPSWLAPLASYASKYLIPFHMHVAEQPREIEACQAETGRRVVELLADEGVLTPRFVAVHGTHLLPHEAGLLGEAGAFVCVCATTERDLGDGLPDLSSLRAAGVRLCTGVDSHVLVDPIDDLRSLETHERLRTGTRVTFRPRGAPAESLWASGSIEGAAACGFAGAGGQVVIRRDHPLLALVDDEFLLDAIVFGGAACMVDRVEPGPPPP
jgi:formiminoglutamate deiminase